MLSAIWYIANKYVNDGPVYICRYPLLRRHWLGACKHVCPMNDLKVISRTANQWYNCLKGPDSPTVMADCFTSGLLAVMQSLRDYFHAQNGSVYEKIISLLFAIFLCRQTLKKPAEEDPRSATANFTWNAMQLMLHQAIRAGPREFANVRAGLQWPGSSWGVEGVGTLVQVKRSCHSCQWQKRLTLTSA